MYVYIIDEIKKYIYGKYIIVNLKEILILYEAKLCLNNDIVSCFLSEI